MNYRLLVTQLFIVLFCINAYSQKVPDKIDPVDVTKRAMDYYHDEKYSEALTEFQKLNENDTLYDNAEVEIANLLVESKKYDEAIAFCKQRIADNHLYSVNFYTAMANALDYLNKSEESIKLYDEAIKKYPRNHLLYFNKALTLQKLKRYNEAEQTYIQGIKVNPNHPGSHLRLGTLYFLANKPTQAIMALEYFLLLEPNSARSLHAVRLAQNIARNEKSKEDEDIVLKDNGDNDFSDIDALIKSKVALSDKFKTKVKIHYDIVKQNQLLLEKIHYNKNDKGFCNEFYASVYEEIWKNDFFEPFISTILQSVDEDDVKKFREKQAKKTGAFFKWAENYILENITPETGTKWNPGDKLYRVYNESTLIAVGQLKNGKLNGNCKYYYASGTLKAEGLVNDNDNKDGTWKYYYPNGIIKETANYENGKLKGEYAQYYENGNKKETGSLIEGNNEGSQKNYYSSGEISTDANYKNGKLDGKVYTYYANGKKNLECTYINGKLDGDAFYHYPNGQIKDEYHLKDGKKEGVYKSYYSNGTVLSSGTYVNDLEEGKYISYYITGAQAYTGAYKSGKRDGKWTYYNMNGKVSEEYNYAGGELNGTFNEYDYDGKLITATEYKNGKIMSNKSFDKMGKILHESKTENKQIKFEVYWSNGNKRAEGTMINQKKQNEWKYYSYNNYLSSVTVYKDDQEDGIKKEFFPDGKIKSEVNYTKGEEDGLYKKYYRNGVIAIAGWVENGLYTGPWYYYREDSTLQRVEYFRRGHVVGKVREYDVYGKLLNCKNFDDNGVYTGLTRYDSIGNVRTTRLIPNGTGSFEELYPNNKIHYKGQFINGNTEGAYSYYYINGNPDREATYLNDKLDGVVKDYYQSGKIETISNYLYGELNGELKKYYENGNISEEENYADGKANGMQKSYAENGKLSREADYMNNEAHGIIKYYDDEGHISNQREYYMDILIKIFSYDKSGALVGKEVQNETIDYTGYFNNGNKSIELHLKNGEFQGTYKRYYYNGKIYFTEEYKDGLEDGWTRNYYKNGNLKDETPYTAGEENGLQKKYYENGTIKSEKPFRMGALHGWCKYYNEQGKLTRKVRYYSGQAIEEIVVGK